MATPRLISLSRRLTTTFLRRTFSSSAATTTSRFSFLRRISAFDLPNTAFPPPSSSRTFATRQSNDNSSNRPPNKTDLLFGCDLEHWLVLIDPPPQDFPRDKIINGYIKTLAQVVGSEEEARMKIYSVSTKHYFAFGALISEELSFKLKELECVQWVLPDSYLDEKNKDYGGEPFIDGQAVPYDPKYHEGWVRNNQKALNRNSRNAGCGQNIPLPVQGFTQNMPPPNNMGNYGGQGNTGSGYNNNVPNYQAGYQNSAQMGNQQSYAQNGGYQNQNVPERDLP